MKTKKYIIAICTLLLLATSCMKDFLEEEVFSNLAPSNFYQTEADALAAVSAVYNNFQFYGNEWWNAGNAYMCMTDASTDIMYTNWFAAFENYTYNSSTLEILQCWNWCWNTNNNANIAIGRLPGITMNEELKSRLIGEAKFLRALNYFNMVRFWGDVPYIDYEIKGFGDIHQVTRMPKADVYLKIIQDLQDAITVLPVSYNAAADAGRVTKGAAKAMLGKVYLTRGWGGGPANINTTDLQLAVDEFEELMTTPYTYALAADVRDVFDYTKENNPALGHIFSVQYSTGISSEGSWLAQNMQAYELENAWWGYPAPESWVQGSGGYEINWVGGWDPVPVDLRLMYLWENYNWWYYWCKKWRYENYIGWADHPQNYTLLRYADVLLMHSEALNELKAAPDAEVVASINMVRTVAGVAVYNPGDWTKATFREEIQNERNRELWGEGHSWFDYTRKGMLVSRMVAAGVDPTLVTTKNNLYPIPQTEIESNPNLGPQNTGW
ncbi:MAG: RagB/SusD family nutrient uptake outer membrane protein [Bacteroidia bacterium]|nr:RagB/SusD family nutrient uptake outer membrane protein [Bacteroidia bacterium]